MIGWGKKGVDQPQALYEPAINEVVVPVLSQAECSDWLGNLNVTDGMICAGYETGGKDACQVGDGCQFNSLCIVNILIIHRYRATPAAR